LSRLPHTSLAQQLFYSFGRRPTFLTPRWHSILSSTVMSATLLHQGPKELSPEASPPLSVASATTATTALTSANESLRTAEDTTPETDEELRRRQLGGDWQWPLTHSARIAELERVLTTEYGNYHRQNLQAAIEYHRGLPADELCSDDLVFFHDGKIVSVEECSLPFWQEVKHPSYLNNVAVLIREQNRVLHLLA
jgi:hypothetical protein